MKIIKKIQSLHNKLLSQNEMKFPLKKEPLGAPIEQGVYIIFDPRGKVLHVGKSARGKEGLKQRLKNHLNKQSSFSDNYLVPNNINLRNGYCFKFLIVTDAKERAYLENLTTGLLCPDYIGTSEKRAD